VLYYEHSHGQLANRRSYLSGVQAVCLNSTHAAVLTAGRVLMHAIDAAADGGAGDTGSAGDVALPEPGAAARAEPITCVALTDTFLVTATAGGALSYHVLQDGKLACVSERKQQADGAAVTAVYPQPCGIRLVAASGRGVAAVYNPLTDELAPLPAFQGDVQQVGVMARCLPGQPVGGAAHELPGCGPQRLTPTA
jgi:hypothetical protein